MTEKTLENEYIAKTREGLSAQIDEALLAPRGFDLRGIEAGEKDCVLVMGLNPAGDVTDARREDEDRSLFDELALSVSDRPWPVFFGDMFYYHGTDSNNLPYRTDWSDEQYGEYCWEMLEKHVCELQAYGKNVRFVYINSAKVSHWLCPDPQKTNELRELGNSLVPIFYGAMLSSGNMDEYSMARLVNEIRNLVNPGKPY